MWNYEKRKQNCDLSKLPVASQEYITDAKDNYKSKMSGRVNDVAEWPVREEQL